VDNAINLIFATCAIDSAVIERAVHVALKVLRQSIELVN
jgi:hypothetical protein